MWSGRVAISILTEGKGREREVKEKLKYQKESKQKSKWDQKAKPLDRSETDL